MYTEITKIIEGGLQGDRHKVFNYAETLATNLEKQGEINLSKKIKAILAAKRGVLATLDGLATKPVDSESRMDMVDTSYPQVDPDQIVLSQHLKEELFRFVEGYKQRDRLLAAGLDISNSLLLYGPPGCGKTTLAKYTSSVLGLPLITARLDGMISSLLGSTAKNIRRIFDYAAKRECVLFLDEFDVVAKLRDDKNELGELKRVVNSLLQNIDDLHGNTILIAATNHHKLLDSAVWRRFSTIISLGMPQADERKELIRVFLRNEPNDVIQHSKRLEQLDSAFADLSHSVIRTIINNAIRNKIINNGKLVKYCDILREIFLYAEHGTDSEEKFIKYLISNNVTRKEIHEFYHIPIRTIKNVLDSK